MSPAEFLIAVGLGRGLRFFGVGLLALWKGQQALTWIHENAATAGLGIAAAIGVFAAALMLWKRRRRGAAA